jgi:hypothetical protein
LYYTYREDGLVLEKSNTPFSDNCAEHGLDFDLETYEYVIGKIKNGTILFFQQRLRSPEIIMQLRKEEVLTLERKITEMDLSRIEAEQKITEQELELIAAGGIA